jgi:hypothetical protein
MKCFKSPHLFLSALLLVAFVAGACSDSSSTPTGTGLSEVQGAASQEVCHLAQTKIDVLLANLEEHIQHGDWIIGPEICDNEDNDCDGAIDEGGVCDGNNDGTD